jgi:hypothetical protein
MATYDMEKTKSETEESALEVSEVLEMLKLAQDADNDMREIARECEHFAYKRDGQWEPAVVSRFSDMPRYTFDQVTPIVDSVCGEIDQMEFACRAIPAGGGANEETAETMDGLFRHIQNISDASSIYRQSLRQTVVTGQAGWRLRSEYVNDESFDQDIIIELIPNFNDRVWFDPASEKQDRSDAEWAVVLHAMPCEKYEEVFGEDYGYSSVGDDKITTVYTDKPEQVIVGEYLYKKYNNRDLVLMTNGAVYADNDDFKAISDELAQLGVTEVKRRSRKDAVVCTRFFNGSEWLDESKETVFSMVPVVPTYGDFLISENKAIWRGKVANIIDPCRVYNYVRSREIAEGALAPRAKYWMTADQAKGHEAKLATLNTNQDPVQFYNHVDNQMPPQQQGGATINQGLEVIAQAMSQDVQRAASTFDANVGANPNVQSGKALQQLQNKGDIGTVKFIKALEIAIRQTALIMAQAVKKVYDTPREQRIIKPDGSTDRVKLQEVIVDQQTMQPITLNDLTKGSYDFICSAGKGFQNRQQETIETMLSMGQYDPTILQVGKDIMLKSLNSPDMDILADRVRSQMVQQGQIPESELTEKELAEKQQKAQQPPQPDPNMMAAQANMKLADAEIMKAQNQAQKNQIDAQLQAATLQGKQEVDKVTMMLKQMEQQSKAMQAMFEMQQTQAETLIKLREAMGIDAIVSPNGMQAYEQQVNEITQTDQYIDQNLQQLS